MLEFEGRQIPGELHEIVDPKRICIVGWGFVQAVLSAWWFVEDHASGSERALEFARLLQLLG